MYTTEAQNMLIEARSTIKLACLNLAGLSRVDSSVDGVEHFSVDMMMRIRVAYQALQHAWEAIDSPSALRPNVEENDKMNFYYKKSLQDLFPRFKVAVLCEDWSTGSLIFSLQNMQGKEFPLKKLPILSILLQTSIENILFFIVGKNVGQCYPPEILLEVRATSVFFPSQARLPVK